MIKVTQQYPQYGVNYGPGFAAFVSHRDDFIAAGIAWFERWDAISKVPFKTESHALNLCDHFTTIEAFENGVWRGTLLDYLHDENVALLVRKPRNLTPDLATRIVNTAQAHIGEEYNNALIAALAAGNMFLGHWLGLKYRRWLCTRADRPDKWICSKLVATSLHQSELVYPGSVLEWPPCTVKPVDLFEDVKIFEDGAVELVPPGHPLDNKS